MLRAGNTTPVAERQRSHCIIICCCTECELTNDDEKPPLNFNDDFDKGFAFSGLVVSIGGRCFHLNVDRITMIVDSVASDHLVDSMEDYKKLKEPKIIVTAGSKEVLATATGTIWGYIIDQAGQRVPLRISAMIVPGLRRNFSPPSKQ